MKYSKVLTFAVCMGAATGFAVVISEWTFGTANLISVFFGLIGGFVAALVKTKTNPP